MIEIIPAIDIIEGKCVRLAQGDFARKKIYGENPLETAKDFEAKGFRRLHIVDLDGARCGKVINFGVLERIAKNTRLAIDFGGGIKTDEDIEAVFGAGAKMASVGSVAVKNAEKFFAWIQKFGGEKILLGADASGGKLAIDGWQTPTDLEILPFLKHCYARGVTQVFCTDISRDGLLQGSANELYAEILRNLPRINLIASGGVGSLEDVAALEKIGCAGVIVGRAFYEGRIKIDDLGIMNRE